MNVNNIMPRSCFETAVAIAIPYQIRIFDLRKSQFEPGDNNINNDITFTLFDEPVIGSLRVITRADRKLQYFCK